MARQRWFLHGACCVTRACCACLLISRGILSIHAHSGTSHTRTKRINLLRPTYLVPGCCCIAVHATRRVNTSVHVPVRVDRLPSRYTISPHHHSSTWHDGTAAMRPCGRSRDGFGCHSSILHPELQACTLFVPRVGYCYYSLPYDTILSHRWPARQARVYPPRIRHVARRGMSITTIRYIKRLSKQPK